MLKTHFQRENNALERNLFSKIDIPIAYKYIDKHCDDDNNMLPFCSGKEIPYFLYGGKGFSQTANAPFSVYPSLSPPPQKCFGLGVTLLFSGSLG